MKKNEHKRGKIIIKKKKKGKGEISSWKIIRSFSDYFSHGPNDVRSPISISADELGFRLVPKEW